ncbi:hypothetical protein OF83DRAFT_1290961 [Amylostereum chailletii]|nr:hypothetical protein OF83DRAFT_1290961 [Amylostereum chailletii]
MADAVCPSAPDIRNTFGTFIIGVNLATLFYGITLLQTGLYFGKLREGSTRTSIFRVKLFTADIRHSVLDTVTWFLELYTTWWYFSVNYANPAALEHPVWSLKLEPAFTYTVALLASMFFIEKIWLLSKNHFVGVMMKVLIAQKTMATLVEVLIAVGMCILLGAHRHGIRRTDSILNRLIVFALSRGLVLGFSIPYSCVPTLSVEGPADPTIFPQFFGFPNNLVWSIFHFSLSKLSSNSVLASLNVREIMRYGTAGQQPSSGRISTSLSLRRVGPTMAGTPRQTHIVLPRDDDGISIRQTQAGDEESQSNAVDIRISTEFHKHVDDCSAVE